MGWIFYNATHLRPNGEVDRKRELDSTFEDGSRPGYTVLKSAVVGRTYYTP